MWYNMEQQQHVCMYGVCVYITYLLVWYSPSLYCLPVQIHSPPLHSLALRLSALQNFN